MCGIAGRTLNEPGSIGADLVAMMAAQRHRGWDSTGFALYGEPLADRLRRPRPARRSGSSGRGPRGPARGHDGARGGLRRRTRPGTKAARRTSWPGSWSPIRSRSRPGSMPATSSTGSSSSRPGGRWRSSRTWVTPTRWRPSTGCEEFIGTHGLGHVRLATESNVSPVAGHPFWARPFPDVAIVHNGQLTNYYTWRRRLQRKGYRFTTENDSELIAVWNSDRMAAGDSLQQSLERSLSELDGVFTYLLATSDGIALAKDRWAIKPVVAVAGARRRGGGHRGAVAAHAVSGGDRRRGPRRCHRSSASGRRRRRWLQGWRRDGRRRGQVGHER